MKVESASSLREDIMASIGLMEIKDYTTLVNKSRLVEECNKRLATTKVLRDVAKKRFAYQD